MIRVMVFHDRPDCMVVFVHDYDGPQTLVIDYPLTRERVMAAAAAAGVGVRVGETAYVGRMKPVFEKLQREQRAERHQQQREREAVLTTLMRTSNKPVERTRAQLMQEKTDVDDELRQLKTDIGVVKSRAYERGVYLPAGEFRKKERRLDTLRSRSLAIQNELGQLREQQRAQPDRVQTTEHKSPNRLAKDAYTSQLLYHVGRLIEERLGRTESEALFKTAREHVAGAAALAEAERA